MLIKAMISSARSNEAFFFFTILQTTLILVLNSQHVSAQLPNKPTFFDYGCYNYTGNYTVNSAYHNNLKVVLSDLISHASAGLPFYGSSAGLSDTVYGLYYCRGDIPAVLCSECVKAATQNASLGGSCFNIKDGVIWYEECTLEYSSKPKIGIMQDSAVSWWYSPENVSDPAKFYQVLTSNMKTMIQRAAYDNASKGFATGKEEVTQIETLYMLVQCRPDTNGSACQTCLESTLRYIKQCCTNYSAEWVYIFYTRCQLRYDLSLFYLPPNPPPPPPSPPSPPGDRKTGKGASYYITRIAVPLVAALILLLLCGGFFCWHKRKNDVANPRRIKDREVVLDHVPPQRMEQEIGNVECFDFRTMESATGNFSDVHKLGQGGFGSVYKGMLPNGQLVAVKRLSRTAGDRMSEFKTEVAVVAKLQHRNLVRLLGYCMDNEERILVYEFVPNLSLDQILFDTTKSIDLDWRTRYKIIEGVAWGLRYLHIDSLLTIVHRDLKSSNILLDKEMNPKIADFGLAKLVNMNETTVDVTTIAGTRGYMAPEYVMTGRCTVKSDIYSFGVIILEILSGKSIGKFYDPIRGGGLLHYAWRLWNERAIEGIMDPTLEDRYSKIEAERCAQIGLLCVQDDEDRRPTIRVLLSMLENQSYELPHPSASNFYRNPVYQVGRTQSSQDEYSGSNFYQNDPNPR